MDIEALILLVKQYEEIYNMQHRDYMNQQRRDSIWEEIGKRMNASGLLCKEKWTRVRENYKKALHLRKLKRLKAASKIKPPKYNKVLNFLIPYVNDEGNKNSHISALAHETESETTSSSVVYSHVDYAGDESEHSESLLIRRTPTRTHSRTSSQRSTDNPTSSVETVLREFLDKQGDVPPNYTQNNSNFIDPESDPLIDFFITMARTVKRFDRKRQLEIKGKLFQLVQSAELEMIDDEEGTSVAREMDYSPEIKFTLPKIPPNAMITNQPTMVSGSLILQMKSEPQ